MSWARAGRQVALLRVTARAAVLLGLLAACSRAPAFRGTTLDPPRDTLDIEALLRS